MANLNGFAMCVTERGIESRLVKKGGKFPTVAVGRNQMPCQSFFAKRNDVTAEESISITGTFHKSSLTTVPPRFSKIANLLTASFPPAQPPQPGGLRGQKTGSRAIDTLGPCNCCPQRTYYRCAPIPTVSFLPVSDGP